MTEPPSGTVTFLFTDLEGSTRLWEQHREAMLDAMARHNEIVQAAIARHDGQIVKSTGDGFHAVFADAASAVNAAVDAQQVLGGETWGPPGELQVRIGLHSGAAEFRGGDYPGPTVNKAAQVMSVANGGQVLVSHATAELVRDQLGTGVGLVDLGEHRLRHLNQPERLFQVRAAGLREGFPPLGSLDVFANNLPVQLTSFIGRESEIRAVAKELEANRLVTLTGAAGCGKTRLALEVGAEVSARFPDGVWLVELAALTDPALVVGAIAWSLGIREATGAGAGFGAAHVPGAGRPLDVEVLEYLRSRRALVILDNCEHMVSVCASFVDRALHECAGLRILATSREPLRVSGEAAWRVPSLSVPEPSDLSVVEALADYDAVRLFMDRAALRAGDFTPTTDDAVAIAQICCRLDGIPLAIELAAARVRVLSPRAIAQRLDDQFLLLTGGGRTVLERHQTLRAALDWSHDLLSDPEQVLLAHLSVFSGGFSLEAVEGICVDEAVSKEQVLDLLERLVDRSLVEAEPGESGIRYRLLESIRLYSGERLTASGDGEQLRNRHRDFFAGFVRSSQAGLWGPDAGHWVAMVDQDLSNVRAAIEWSLGRGEHDAALRLVTYLDYYWIVPPGNAREGLAWLERCLTDTVDDLSLRARALAATCFLHGHFGAFGAAMESGELARSLYRVLDDTRGLAMVLSSLSRAARSARRLDAAQQYADDAVTVAREAGFTPALGGTLVSSGLVAMDRGDLEQARAAYREVLRSREHDSAINVQQALDGLGVLALVDRDYEAARRWFQDSAAVAGAGSDHNSRVGLVVVAIAMGELTQARQLIEETLEFMVARDIVPSPRLLALLADVALQEDRLEEAERLGRRAVEHAWNGGFPSAVPLATLAHIAATRGDWARAATLLGASDTIAEQDDWYRVPFEWRVPNQLANDVRTALGADAYSAARQKGFAMDQEQAAEYVLERTERSSD